MEAFMWFCTEVSVVHQPRLLGCVRMRASLCNNVPLCMPAWVLGRMKLSGTVFGLVCCIPVLELKTRRLGLIETWACLNDFVPPNANDLIRFWVQT
ncbi:hypothetical protein SCA6_005430 [Theobroma cacao]